MTPRLVATGLCRRFAGVVALDGVDVAVAAGEVVAAVGPNGSGKSTLLNAITRLERLDAGRVVLEGRDVTGAGPRRLARSGVARPFQAGRLLARGSALENVLLGLHSAGPRAGWLGGSLPGLAARHRRRALAALAQVGLADAWDAQVGVLSHGQRRRVELARAFAGRPRLLVLDEPTAGLTPEDTGGVAALVAAARDRGAAVLLVEHDLDIVGALASRVIVLEGGRVVAQGAPAGVLADAAVSRLLGIAAGPAERLEVSA